MSLWNLGQEGGRYDKSLLALGLGGGLSGLAQGYMKGTEMQERRMDTEEERKIKALAQASLEQHQRNLETQANLGLEDKKADREQRASSAENEIRGRMLQTLIERGMLPKEAISPEGGIDSEALINRALGRPIPRRRMDLPNASPKDSLAPKKPGGFWKGILGGAKEKWKEFDK